jgi:hypothetical protein
MLCEFVVSLNIRRAYAAIAANLMTKCANISGVRQWLVESQRRIEAKITEVFSWAPELTRYRVSHKLGLTLNE